MVYIHMDLLLFLDTDFSSTKSLCCYGHFLDKLFLDTDFSSTWTFPRQIFPRHGLFLTMDFSSTDFSSTLTFSKSSVHVEEKSVEEKSMSRKSLSRKCPLQHKLFVEEKYIVISGSLPGPENSYGNFSPTKCMERFWMLSQ